MIVAIRRYFSDRQFARSREYRAWAAKRKSVESVLLKALSKSLPPRLGDIDDLQKLTEWISDRQSHRFVLTRKLSEVTFLFGQRTGEQLKELASLHIKATASLQGVAELRRQEISESGLSKKSLAARATWIAEYALAASEFNQKRKLLAERLIYANAHLPPSSQDWVSTNQG